MPGGGTAIFLPLRSATFSTSPLRPIRPTPWRAVMETILLVSLPSLAAMTVL